MKVYLKNSIIINTKKYTAYDIAIYIAIRSNIHKNKTERYVSLNQIIYELFGCLYSDKCSKRSKNNLSSSINKLITQNDLELKDKMSQSEYIIETKKFLIDINDDDYYIVANNYDIIKILTCNYKIDKFLLLRYYLALLTTINLNDSIEIDDEVKSNFIGYMTQEYLSSISGVTQNTISKYNSILDNLKLIYTYNHDVTRKDENDRIKTIINHYGRYEDKKYIKEYAIRYENSINQDIKAKKQSNENKSLANKYNSMIKNNKKYSIEEYYKIYNYIHKYNIKIINKINNSKDENYKNILKNKLRDEKIFDGKIG